MKSMLDAAYAPGRFLSGQAWAGYLASPTATHAWSHAQLVGARDAGGLLPIYVAPLSAAGYARHDGGRDAANALAQVHAIGVDRIVIALDTEAGAYEAAPSASVRYAVKFTAAVHAAGGITVHYGSARFLEALAGHVSGHNAYAWLAWYTEQTAWPRSLAAWSHSPWAWQYRDNVHAQGTTVDVSRITDTFPLCRHPRPPAPPRPPAAPAAAAHPPAGVTVTTAHASSSDLELAAAFHRWAHSKGLS